MISGEQLNYKQYCRTNSVTNKLSTKIMFRGLNFIFKKSSNSEVFKCFMHSSNFHTHGLVILATYIKKFPGHRVGMAGWSR